VVAIEGTWGLGSALVSGDVTPDSFVISKITGEITGRRVSSKGQMHSYLPNGLGVSVTDIPPDLRDRACLTDDEVRALAALGGRVETHYGTPQDIEWAVLDEDGEAADTGAADTEAAPAAEASPDPAAAAAERIVLLQSRPETVWAARAPAPLAAPRPHAADHVLALFGKPL
jgi:pyruvate,water dikinase